MTKPSRRLYATLAVSTLLALALTMLLVRPGAKLRPPQHATFAPDETLPQGASGRP